jgi:CheY-like chemotaxis protein
LGVKNAPKFTQRNWAGPELRQVLTTLLINAAVPVMQQEATVEVRTALACVEDRAAEEVWEPVRGSECEILMVEAGIQNGEVETASTLAEEGVIVPGFALSSAREIVRSLGGDLCWVESPSRGRRLRMLIPCNGEAAAQAARQKNASADRELVFEGTVLVVDDEKSSRKVISTILERVGSTVLTASSGEEALSIYEEHAEQIELVLLDMSMPGLGGKETFRRLYALDENVKVLVMSGYDEGTGLDGLKKEEVLGYLQKPFRLQGLKDKLIEIMPRLR